MLKTAALIMLAGTFVGSTGCCWPLEEGREGRHHRHGYGYGDGARNDAPSGWPRGEAPERRGDDGGRGQRDPPRR
jgi:hypothetical protein